MSRFDDCLEFILRWEGGAVDHPNDKGGRTNKGITQKNYDTYRRSRGLALRDVFGIDDSEVKEIYLKDYWVPCGGSMLPKPLDLIVFDTAVNCGVRRASRWLQTALGMEAGEVDGVIGKHTLLHLSEAKSINDIDRVSERFMALRERHYTGLAAKDATQKVFLKGWMNRLIALGETTDVRGVA